LHGEKSDGPDMKDLTSTSFGYLIAYLLPGLFGVYGLSYWCSTVRRFVAPTFRDAGLGPSIIFLLAVLGVGLCINAFRHLVFEQLLCRKHTFPDEVFTKLVLHNRLAAFKTVVDEHYRYHQFYGGLAVTLLILYAGWCRENYSCLDSRFIALTLGFLALEWLLSDTAVKTYIQYVERGCMVVNSE
jgi:hypothetical protein